MEQPAEACGLFDSRPLKNAPATARRWLPRGVECRCVAIDPAHVARPVARRADRVEPREVFVGQVDIDGGDVLLEVGAPLRTRDRDDVVTPVGGRVPFVPSARIRRRSQDQAAGRARTLLEGAHSGRRGPGRNRRRGSHRTSSCLTLAWRGEVVAVRGRYPTCPYSHAQGRPGRSAGC